MYVNRPVVQSIRSLLSQYPIVSITGPRQSGKTTMLKEQFDDYQYVNMELSTVREFATRDPQGFFDSLKDKVILDEVQRVPELFSYLQVIVDEERRMGRFILSGSQSFGLLRSIQQSLAGRIAILELLPFDQEELRSAALLSDQYVLSILRGSYPALHDRGIPPQTFYRNYIRTYVERDVPEVLDIKDAGSFRNFIRAIAARVGSVMNWTKLSSDASISFATSKNWMSILESSYVAFTLPAYTKSFSKRIVKSPKVFFYDTGLLCYLLGIKSIDALNKSRYKGHIFENYIVSEIIKHAKHGSTDILPFYWRDSNGNEVDLIFKEADHYKVIEIKSGMTIKMNQFKGLHYFGDVIESHETIEKHLVYGGNQNYQFTDVHIHSWDRLVDLVKEAL